MREPKRIQRKRTRGWRMPDGAIYVGRGSQWGNPFVVGNAQLRFPREDGSESWEYEGRLHKTSGQRHAFVHSDVVTDDEGLTSYRDRTTWHDVRDATREECVALYREYVTGQRDLLDWQPRSEVAAIRAALAGRDLACWCPLDQPCHADVLLEIANAPSPVSSVPDTQKD